MGETAQVLRLLLRRWPILLVGVAMGVAGAILATGLMPPSTLRRPRYISNTLCP